MDSIVYQVQVKAFAYDTEQAYASPDAKGHFYMSTMVPFSLCGISRTKAEKQKQKSTLMCTHCVRTWLYKLGHVSVGSEWMLSYCVRWYIPTSTPGGFSTIIIMGRHVGGSTLGGLPPYLFLIDRIIDVASLIDIQITLQRLTLRPIHEKQGNSKYDDHSRNVQTFSIFSLLHFSHVRKHPHANTSG